MEHINHNKFLLQIKDQNISITDIKDKKTHFDILAKLDYKAPNCPCCRGTNDQVRLSKALEQPYSNAKLEATNNLIKVIKRNAFGFRSFKNFKTRLLIALNIQKERTKIVLSRC